MQGIKPSDNPGSIKCKVVSYYDVSGIFILPNLTQIPAMWQGNFWKMVNKNVCKLKPSYYDSPSWFDNKPLP